MASAVGSGSTAGVWLFRGLALGSTAYVAGQLAPVMHQTPAFHAVALVYSQEALLATEGVRRVGRHARRSVDARRKVVEAGAVRALGHAVGRGDGGLREAALLVLADVCTDAVGVDAVLKDRGLADGLCQEKDAVGIWRRAVEVDGGAERVREARLCTQCCEEVRELLREAGAC